MSGPGLEHASLDALSEAQRATAAEIFASDYYRWCGVELLEIEPGRSKLRFTPRVEMCTPWGGLNGSVLNSLLELPNFLALLPSLAPEEFAVTNDIFVQQLRPAPGDAEIVLAGRLLRRGRSMAWCESSASAGGKDCALARVTKSIVPAPRRELGA